MFQRKRFDIILHLSAFFLVISAITRTVLLLKIPAGSGLTASLIARSYATGLIFDLATLAYAMIPLALLLVVAPRKLLKFCARFHLDTAAFFALCGILLFASTAEYLFFDEFGTRFNFIAVDYLVYTSEVIGNIRESYPLHAIFLCITVAAGLITFALRKRVHSAWLATVDAGPRSAGLALLVLPFIAWFAIDVCQASFSRNNYATELAGNGIYSLVAAFRNNELDFGTHYLTRDDTTTFARLRSLIRESNNRYVAPEKPGISRAISNSGEEKRLNVIVIVEESLSAEYLTTFGNTKGITPNLDRLAKESLLFTHLYATGTRTVRGLEAINLSMPPLPGTSIVKRPKNENFFSWGSVMREKGYDTKFIYGGFGYFDNMNYFFANNGFNVVDRNNMDKSEITFANVWGVCDEDLFYRVIKEGGKSYDEGRPFFSVVMTTSNHRPYTFPDGKIDLPSKTAGRDGGVKYADYAIGRLITESRKKPWFKDTVFVIIADHCASSAGKTELPVKKYEIPLLVYSPAHVKPAVIDRTMSQIDLAPTVLGLLNFSYQTRFLGRDIMKAEGALERAFISTYQMLGYIQDDRLVILTPRKQAAIYRFDRKSGAVTPVPKDDEYLENALGYYQGANYVYKNRLNRIK